MTTTTTSPALDLWIVLARAFESVRAQTEIDIRRHGLTPGEFGVLEALYHKGSMSLTELQQKILVTSGGMTYLMDQLEKKGHVSRQAVPTDRRACQASLTAKGRKLIARIFPSHAEKLELILAGLSPAEQKTARALLRKLGLHAAQLSDTQ
jgi:MarR family 2-MHQ and catechol resistance regulon transcriptional repressor